MHPPHRQPLVLIIDDDSTMRLLARETLEQAGFAVEEAVDGQAGVEAFSRAAPDAVLLDVTMPKLDGFGACAAIRGLPGGEHVPVLMMTGLDDPRSIDRAYEAGATDFVSKPITWAVLGHRVRYLLRTSRAVQDLKQSEARLARAQRIAHLGHWDFDCKTGRMQRSPEIDHILGRESSGLADTCGAFIDAVHIDDRRGVEALLLANVPLTAPTGIEVRVVRPDGSVRVTHLQAEPGSDAGNGRLHLQGTLQDITERKRAEERIRHLALYDGLTGLPNRQCFKEQLTRALAQAQRGGHTVAMLSLGLDRFKRINDTLGHKVGDVLLQEVAKRLLASLRQSDSVARGDPGVPTHCVARSGSDEFTLLVELQHGQDAAKIARRLLDALYRPPFSLEDNELVLSASIGIALYPLDGLDAERLLRNADAAMFHAKQQGKNDYRYYNRDMNASALEKLTLESDLRKALERNELVLHYQPKVDACKSIIIGMEALLRWKHPQRGLVPPADFIPLAEETGLIVPIGEWVLRTACAQASNWARRGFGRMQVAVNMSSLNLAQDDLDGLVADALRTCGLDARCLELEVTETVLMQNMRATVEKLKRLKSTGIKLSIDDFGTGYSSLSYLKRLPLDAIKIDRSFVRDITEDADDAVITSTIIAMAQSLKLTVIAEGVETEAQAALLREQGCRYMQGYLFGRPVAAEEYAATFLKTRRIELAAA